MYDKFVGFVADMDEIGIKIGHVQKAYDDAKSKLVTGRGNLIRQAEQVKNLGVKPTKSIPAHLLSDVDMDMDANIRANISANLSANISANISANTEQNMDAS